MEDVLERHRSKLQEHRHFLQSYKTASVDESADGPCASQPDTAMTSVADTRLAGHAAVDDDAPSPAARAPPGTNAEEDITSVPIYLAPKAAHATSPHPQQTQQKDQSRQAVASDVRDVDALLRARGRYASSQPADAMYVKSQAWLRRRAWQTEAARRAKEEEEREACTFAPRLSSVEAARVYSNPEDERWIETAGEERRARRAQGGSSSGERQNHREATPPHGGSGTRVRSAQRQPTVGVLSDPAVVKHMTRLEAARRRREDDEKRVRGVDIEKWRNETTKPRPFQLGVRPAEPIPSLRKPYVGGLDKAHFDPSAFMGSEEVSVVDLLKAQVRQRDLVIDDQEREILHLQQELREVKTILQTLLPGEGTTSNTNADVDPDEQPHSFVF